MSTGLPDLNRRNFIKVTSIGTAAMLVGCSTHSPLKSVVQAKNLKI